MEKSLSYSDIFLVPRYSELESRSLADVSVQFLGRKFNLPVIPSNMSSVVDINICKWLSFNNYPYIYHRFADTKAFVIQANKENWPLISISVGVKDLDRKLIKELQEYRVDWVCIDTAHGHSKLTKDMIEFIKTISFGRNLNDYYDNSVRAKIIAGNVATPEAVRDLAEWGADCVKVGIAGGGACSTKNMTGFHIPMFSCVKNCVDNGGMKQVARLWDEGGGFKTKIIPSAIPIIADGGVRENGDIAKALVAGATLVMGGTIFAACIDAPGDNVTEEVVGHFEDSFGNTLYGLNTKIIAKKYFGSASARQKGQRKHVEGFEIEIPCNGLTYAEKYQQITESLQSSVSYGGGKSLSCFKNVKWVITK